MNFRAEVGVIDGMKGSNASAMIRGNLFMFVATLFFGVNIPVVKLLISEWMSANDVTLFRLMGGAVLMWAASLFLHPAPLQKRDWLKVILGGAVGMFSFIYLLNASLRYGDPIDISIIMTFPPVWVIIINVLFKHHKVNWMEAAGVLMAFAGAFLVIVTQHAGEKGSDNMLGDVLALASTLCYAFYLVILEGPSHTYRPTTLLRWVFLFASVPALFLWPGVPHAAIVHTADWRPWLEIGFVVLCPTFLAYFLVQPAIKLIGSELVSMWQYVLPVFAIIASVIFGIATLHLIQVAAMVLIVAGMWLTNRHTAK